MTIRPIILELSRMEPLPSEDDASEKDLKKYEELILAIATPISNDEARMLVNLFGEDGCFGLASSLVQRIESAPGWPLVDCLKRSENPWIQELTERAKRGGRL